MKISAAWAFCVSLIIATLLPHSAQATLTFAVTPCQYAVNCVVGEGPHGTGFSAGPTNSDFVTWFNGLGGVDNTTQYAWGITGTSEEGFSIGPVSTNDVCCFETAFIFDGSSVICCYIDEPYVLVDINDNNLIVGDTAYDNLGPFQTGFLASAGEGGEAPQIPFVLTNASSSFLEALDGGHLPDMSFDAIDNKNRILAECRDFACGDFQYFVLTPVPEPATLVLVGAGFVGAFSVGRRRRKWV